MVNKVLQGCHIYFFGEHQDWTPVQVQEWVKQAGGHATRRLTDETTHVLVSEKLWKKQDQRVQEVLSQKAKGRNIHILPYDWLEESLMKKARRKEAARSWDKVEKRASATGNETRSQAGLVKNLFTTSTDGFIDAREHKRIEKEQHDAAKAQEKEEEYSRNAFEEQRDKLRVKEVAAIFRRGAQRARNEILSDNHHVFMDSSGFNYDIHMTRVDSKKNTNERYTLTIYESNTTPHTYALNCQYAATGKGKVNNIIAALGSTQETALRAFRKVFKEKTRVEWEDRTSAAIERSTKQTAGQHSQEGWVNQPFHYYPPSFGSRGEINKDHQVVAMEGNPGVYNGAPKTDAGMETRPLNLQSGPCDVTSKERMGMATVLEDHHSMFTHAFDDPFDFGRSELYEGFGSHTDNEAQGVEYFATPGHPPNEVETPLLSSDQAGTKHVPGTHVGPIVANDHVLGKRKLQMVDMGREDAESMSLRRSEAATESTEASFNADE